MLELVVSSVLAFHDRLLRDPGGQAPGGGGPWPWIRENHRCNLLLWREEDSARRTDVPDAAIAQCKRNIDRYNQRRNDAVEAIDDAVGTALAEVAPTEAARLSSETAGAMIDRLSILSLKIHHMRAQAERVDAGEAHRAACAEKHARLAAQRADLAACLERLLDEAHRGLARFPVYRQFKMYNDPALNPELYGRRARNATAAGEAVEVLIPTFERPAALAATLTALCAQSRLPTRAVVSDQGEACEAAAAPEVQAALRLLRAKGCAVELHRHLPRRGLAEQRSFLLAQARAPYALFLDDGVILEPDLLERLLRAIASERCGFVGSAVIGLSFIDDVRPHQQRIELWDGPVTPEAIAPGGPEWARHELHDAANLYHLQRRLGLSGADQRLYRVAWIGGCVLYDTAKLREAGGFDFWRELPERHCGEDVLAQLRVMARFGGCGVIPSGAYHQELPTTVREREIDAPHVLARRLA